MNEALNTQSAYRLWDQYFAAMTCNLLKVAPPDMTFAKFQVECISIFGNRSRMAAKSTVCTSTVKSHKNKSDQLVKLANQLSREKKKGKIRAQTIVIEWQKKEITNLKATGMQLDPKKMIEAMTQAMVCIYNTQKGPSQKLTSTIPTGGKPYLGKSRPPEVKGLDGTTNPSLVCHYCRDTGHELDNCSKPK